MVRDLFRDSLFHGCSIVWRTTTTTCSSISIACSGVVWGECNAWSEWNLERKSTKNRKGKKEEEEEVTKMPCSAVTLSLATITGIIATGLLAIAFSTDNWLYTEVKRAQIQVRKSNLFFFTSVLFTMQLWNLSVKNLGCHVVLFHIFHVFVISFKFRYLWNITDHVSFLLNIFSFLVSWSKYFFLVRDIIILMSHFYIDDFYKSVCRIWFLNVLRTLRYSSRCFLRRNTIIIDSIISDIPINTYGEFSWISRWNVILKIRIYSRIRSGNMCYNS